MKQLLTKCCQAPLKTVDNGGGEELHFCASCETENPHMEWVAFCEGCRKPGRFCECP